MDAFAQAVEDARQRLSRTEGRNVSVREVARRAGVAESTLAYNISSERAERGRRVRADLVEALARVLPISEDDLMRAAQVAAGYQVREPDFPDLGAAVTRFLDDRDVPESEKRQLRARLADILAAEMRKAAESRNGQ
jgi:transcriptional regulator with XRE-family HTH domain